MNFSNLGRDGKCLQILLINEISLLNNILNKWFCSEKCLIDEILLNLIILCICFRHNLELSHDNNNINYGYIIKKLLKVSCDNQIF